MFTVWDLIDGAAKLAYADWKVVVKTIASTQEDGEIISDVASLQVDPENHILIIYAPSNQ